MATINPAINKIDEQIIELLQADATITTNDIAKKINLSSSATNERIRKLHSNGIIRKISAFIQAAAVEKSLCAFICVTLDAAQKNKAFLHSIDTHSMVMECHHITGEYSYLLKVRVKNTQELESFITDFLKTKNNIVRTLTQIVLSSPKDGDTIID
jgi:Lrp/AsnC family leucine-responsive transcriptional regulator